MEGERPSDYACLFLVASQLLATIDKEGSFQTLNPAWRRALGWSVDELHGRQTTELIHPDDRERTLAALGGMNVEVHDLENRFAHKHGGWRWLRWRAWSERRGLVCVRERCDREQGARAKGAGRPADRAA